MTKDRPVAVVTGASRGIGKGTALALAERGFTVYLAARDGARREGEAVLLGSLAETVAAVDAAGGRGVAVRCDMAKDDQIESLFARVHEESGGLDLLVNSAAFLHDSNGLPTPFWEKPAALADIIDVGLRCHYIALRSAVPLMVGRPHPLVVNISFHGHAAMHDPAYYAAKAGMDAMAATAAADLRSAGIAIVSLWPGVVSTERVEQVIAEMPEVVEQLPTLESPLYIGRTIAALYDDDRLSEISGKTLIVAELAQRYGIMDEGEVQPKSLRDALGSPHPANDFAYATKGSVNAQTA